MITIKQVRTLDGQVTDYKIPSATDQVIDAEGRLLLWPGVIDPHINFGAMGDTANWSAALSAAVKGGVTAAIEIPHDEMPGTQKKNLEEKRKRADALLSTLQSPIRLFLYARADRKEVEQLGSAKQLIKGVVIQLDPRTKEWLDDSWKRVFQMAAWQNLPIVVNSAHENSQLELRPPGVRETFLEKAFHYAEQQNVRLYVLNVAQASELELIRSSRKRAILIYAETTPEHLFQKDQTQADILWNALNAGEIETIGSGYYADQKTSEKILFKGASYPLLHPLFFLPRLLTASLQGKISKEKIVHLTRLNLFDVFDLPDMKDFILIDLDKEETIQQTDGKTTTEYRLKGWPTTRGFHPRTPTKGPKALWTPFNRFVLKILFFL